MSDDKIHKMKWELRTNECNHWTGSSLNAKTEINKLCPQIMKGHDIRLHDFFQAQLQTLLPL